MTKVRWRTLFVCEVCFVSFVFYVNRVLKLAILTKQVSIKMSYAPAGYEDFDSDSDGFDFGDGSYDYTDNNTQSASNSRPASYKCMPAGAEIDSSDDEGICFSSKASSSFPGQNGGRNVQPAKHKSVEKSFVGGRNKDALSAAGRGRGRGRGGFPSPPRSSTRGGRPSQPSPRLELAYAYHTTHTYTTHTQTHTPHTPGA